MEIDRSCIKKGNKRHHKNGAKMDTRRKMWRGQQRTTWRRTVEKEDDINLTWGDTERISTNKEEWTSIVLTLFASGCNKDKVGSFIEIISFDINRKTKTKTKTVITYSL